MVQPNESYRLVSSYAYLSIVQGDSCGSGKARCSAKTGTAMHIPLIRPKCLPQTDVVFRRGPNQRLNGYNVTTIWGLLATCLGLISLAVLYEGMKVLQMKLQHSTMASLQKPVSTSSENSSLLSKMSPRYLATSPSTHCGSCYKWTIQVLHWSIHTTLGYILMVAVMTYNAYVSIALVIGGGLGYWIFGPTLIQLNMTRFYKTQRNIQCDKECADANDHPERRISAVSLVVEQLVTEATAEVHAPRDVPNQHTDS